MKPWTKAENTEGERVLVGRYILEIRDEANYSTSLPLGNKVWETGENCRLF